MVLRKSHIRFTGKIFVVYAEPVTTFVKSGANQYLWFGIFPLNTLIILERVDLSTISITIHAFQ